METFRLQAPCLPTSHDPPSVTALIFHPWCRLRQASRAGNQEIVGDVAQPDAFLARLPIFPIHLSTTRLDNGPFALVRKSLDKRCASVPAFSYRPASDQTVIVLLIGIHGKIMNDKNLHGD